MRLFTKLILGFIAIPLIMELAIWLLVINQWILVLVILCVTGIIITNIVMKNRRR